jgi:hypothetical protein
MVSSASAGAALAAASSKAKSVFLIGIVSLPILGFRRPFADIVI